MFHLSGNKMFQIVNATKLQRQILNKRINDLSRELIKADQDRINSIFKWLNAEVEKAIFPPARFIFRHFKKKRKEKIVHYFMKSHFIEIEVHKNSHGLAVGATIKSPFTGKISWKG